ncbi:MAG: DsbA family oxidoreductase [Proteobacteria bacterium]|nr:DsbA family oxidoreductase [Pseudomonadota bacterium]MDA1059588.1 DsbA family oxidoreductase [Pseudomonadota bacterium]
MKIDIISDTICPWCFVGKRRLEAALAERPELDVEIVWHPYQLNPTTPKEGVDRKDYLREKFGSETYPDGMLGALGEAGHSTGIGFKFNEMNRVPNTINSHRVLHWARESGCQDALAEILFRRYFIDNEDIGDPDTLVAAAEEAGLDPTVIRERLADDTDDELVRAEAQHASKMGITGVPTFIVDGRYAVQGAQTSDVFLQVFDKIAEELQAADAEPAAAAGD